jgi:guanylate kinase
MANKRPHLESDIVNSSHTNNRPGIYVISAPSGTGKTTLNRRLIAEHPQVQLSVSHTTRTKRTGEKNGDHYWFVSQGEFDALLEKNSMLEYANVHGAYYGTSLTEVERIQAQGCTVLLEIDVQGWRQVQTKISSATAVLIVPPTMEALWKRLSARKTDSPEQTWRRFQNARTEIEQCEHFQYFIINNSLEIAYQELEQLLIHKSPPSLSHAQGLAHCKKLLQEFDADPQIQQLKVQYAAPSTALTR